MLHLIERLDLLQRRGEYIPGVGETTARTVGTKASTRYSFGEIALTLVSGMALGLDIVKAFDFVEDAATESGRFVITAWELVGRAIGK